MEIQERFLRAIDYIEDHLFEPLPLSVVADCSELSRHYFSRLFRILTGESFGAYVRRRRLTFAAEQLASGNPVALVELALDCQYESQEAFTRAFKKWAGTTPGEFRKHPPGFRMNWRFRIDSTTLGHLKEIMKMEAQICEIDSFIVAGVRERFGPDSKHLIPELWDRLIPEIPKIPDAVGGTTYGICIGDDSEDGSFDYIAGIGVTSVDTLPSGIVAETIPRQTYAMFRHVVGEGSLHEGLQRTLRWIYGTWLPESNYELELGPDFELYPPDFNPEDREGYLDICLPVRRLEP